MCVCVCGVCVCVWGGGGHFPLEADVPEYQMLEEKKYAKKGYIMQIRGGPQNARDREKGVKIAKMGGGGGGGGGKGYPNRYDQSSSRGIIR